MKEHAVIDSDNHLLHLASGDDIEVDLGKKAIEIDSPTALAIKRKPVWYNESIGKFALLYTEDASPNSIGPKATIDKSGLTLLALTDLFNEAQSAIEKSTLFANYPGELSWDYGVYRLGDDDYLAAGITWPSDGRIFSAKYQGEEITDYYEIHKDGDYFSSQIDPLTLEPIAHYSNGGDTKIDSVSGEIMQESHRVTGIRDLPPEFARLIIEVRAPFFNEIFYYAEKPYGKTVEFSMKGLFE